MTESLISAAPEGLRQDVRPPIAMDPAPTSGAAEGLPHSERRTACPRPHITPIVWPGCAVEGDYPLDHPYVRRFWTALIGPGAVADLLRLATAAQRGRSLLRPVHLPTLTRVGLVTHEAQRVMVRTTVPRLTPTDIRSLHPALREEHRRLRPAT